LLGLEVLPSRLLDQLTPKSLLRCFSKQASLKQKVIMLDDSGDTSGFVGQLKLTADKTLDTDKE
jgi:hypothetical protein